jgi:hypothetical protein
VSVAEFHHTKSCTKKNKTYDEFQAFVIKTSRIMSYVLGGVTIFRVRIRVWIRERVRVKIRVRVRIKFKIQKNTKLQKSKNSKIQNK